MKIEPFLGPARRRRRPEEVEEECDPLIQGKIVVAHLLILRMSDPDKDT
jgi:hypothetical protein